MTERVERSEVGRDALDVEVGGAELRSLRIGDLLGRTRAALGLRPIAAPALIFVPLGAAVGPTWLGWITPVTLGHLYPTVAVALAALGIFVGFGLHIEDQRERRLLALSSLEAAVTIGVVALACGLLLARWQLDAGVGGALVALVLGICASATSAGEVGPDEPLGQRTAMRIADLDDVLPIAIGGVALAFSTGESTTSALKLTGLGIFLPLPIALAGWLLFERARDPGERGVFVVGVVTLLGGSAAYLGISPLLAGMTAGIFWKYSPGHADAIIGNDLKRLQHPLVVLLLIFTGAVIEFSYAAVWIGVAYTLTRLCGKLLAGWLVSRATPSLSPADLGSYLLAPGVIGLAFALNFHLVELSVVSAAVLAAVAFGTLASELLAAIVLIGPRRAG